MFSSVSVGVCAAISEFSDLPQQVPRHYSPSPIVIIRKHKIMNINKLTSDFAVVVTAPVHVNYKMIDSHPSTIIFNLA